MGDREWPVRRLRQWPYTWRWRDKLGRAAYETFNTHPRRFPWRSLNPADRREWRRVAVAVLVEDGRSWRQAIDAEMRKGTKR